MTYNLDNSRSGYLTMQADIWRWQDSWDIGQP